MATPAPPGGASTATATAASTGSGGGTSAIRLFISADFPRAVWGLCTVPTPSTTTLRDLRALISRTLVDASAAGADADASKRAYSSSMDGCTLTAVAFGKLPVHLTDLKTSMFVSELPILAASVLVESKDSKDSKAVPVVITSIVITPPVEYIVQKSRAAIRARRQATGDAGGGDGKTKGGPDKDGFDDRRYKGISIRNVLTKYAKAVTDTGTLTRTICQEYFEMHAQRLSEAMMERKRGGGGGDDDNNDDDDADADAISKDDRRNILAAWQSFPLSVIVKFLSSNRVNVETETVVLDLAASWMKGETAKKLIASAAAVDTKDTKGENSSDGWPTELVNTIRFPLLNANDLALKVSAINVLSQEQILSLFTYAGQKTAADNSSGSGSGSGKAGFVPLPKELKMFTATVREGRISASSAVFNKEQIAQYHALSNHNRTITHKDVSGMCSTTTFKKWITKGVHRYHIRIDRDEAQHWLVVGVVTRQYQGHNSRYNGFIGGDGMGTGYGWACGDGSNIKRPTKWGPGITGASWGRSTYGTGDVVTIILDMNKRTLDFELNGEKISNDGQPSFTGLPDEVIPAVSTYDVGDAYTIVGSAKKTKKK